MNNSKPIGLFDSGVGGLSVLLHIREILPNENMLYVADSGYAPYGCKGVQFIEQRSRVITEALLEQGAKVIVIACNTATASIIEKFRKEYGIPFVGVEPGIKPAIGISKNGHIGVMATVATLASGRYKELSRRFAQSVTLYDQPCPGLADQVEFGEVHSQQTQDLLQTFISPLLEQKIDTLVLGCTHYSFLRTEIQKLAGNSIHIVDTSRAIAEQLNRVLTTESLLNASKQGQVSYFTTGSINTSRLAMERLLGHQVVVNHLESANKI